MVEKLSYKYFECRCDYPFEMYTNVVKSASMRAKIICKKCGNKITPIRKATKEEIKYQLAKNIGCDCK